ncbi:tRNA pseudouridine(38-40) synthase TruA [Lentilitoribacter sp. EG35]|uniref:tRNA pseudouridine(38-40) synthase TruA n=1 Tax=Lentilitoribacter sp. EG35 TaxID=3234192 RepID=UPI003460BE60
MPRYKITIEYDGTDYFGWQRQPNYPSIQGAIEKAILGFLGEDAVVYGAGRTDARVHARGQVAHFDLTKDRTPLAVQGAINAFLREHGDHSIAIIDAEEVDSKFHARFSAKRRHYLYRYLCRHGHPGLERNRAFHVSKQLDVAKMHEAAQRLVGVHDFTTFRATSCQAKSPVRLLEKLDVVAVEGTEFIELHATAPAFLHNQIRSFAGTLKKVGEGKWTADDVTKALEAKKRVACGPVAPPFALYFMSVDY